jgi:uncharacterized membrane protein YhhN
MALSNSRRNHRSSYLIWKVGASLLFLASAVVIPPSSDFDRLLIIGLLGHALGDLLIAWPSAKGRFLFPVAIGSFLAGHVLYFLAFQSSRGLWELHWGMLLVSVCVNFSAFYVVRTRLGRLQIPGFFYTLAMTLMTAAALSSALSGSGPALLLGCGAVLYNLSDGAVVRERFVSPSFANKLWGLPAYYIAQHILVATMIYF